MFMDGPEAARMQADANAEDKLSAEQKIILTRKIEELSLMQFRATETLTMAKQATDFYDASLKDAIAQFPGIDFKAKIAKRLSGVEE